MQVRLIESSDLTLILNYLHDNCPSATFSTYNVYWGSMLDIWFADPQDATLFVLRWQSHIVDS